VVPLPVLRPGPLPRPPANEVRSHHDRRTTRLQRLPSKSLQTPTLENMNGYVTTGVAAKHLGISAATLTRWAAAGTVIPAQRTAGGHYRWDLAALRGQVRKLNPQAPTNALAEDIASVIHDANRRLQIIEGDPRPSPLWDEAPERQTQGATESVELALADQDRTAEENHQGWMERLATDGWQWGEVKDEQAKTHPLLVPFDQLPAEAQRKDRMFLAIVRALSS
jgi:DNA-binding transcriptional MerR regulator